MSKNSHDPCVRVKTALASFNISNEYEVINKDFSDDVMRSLDEWRISIGESRYTIRRAVRATPGAARRACKDAIEKLEKTLNATPREIHTAESLLLMHRLLGKISELREHWETLDTGLLARGILSPHQESSDNVSSSSFWQSQMQTESTSRRLNPEALSFRVSSLSSSSPSQIQTESTSTLNPEALKFEPEELSSRFDPIAPGLSQFMSSSQYNHPSTSLLSRQTQITNNSMASHISLEETDPETEEFQKDCAELLKQACRPNVLNNWPLT